MISWAFDIKKHYIFSIEPSDSKGLNMKLYELTTTKLVLIGFILFELIVLKIL